MNKSNLGRAIRRAAKLAADTKTIYLDNSIALSRIKRESSQSVMGQGKLVEAPLIAMYQSALNHLKGESQIFKNNKMIKEFVSLIHEKVEPILSSQAHVLDIGCGIGMYGKAFSEQATAMKNWRYVGAEQTYALTKLARTYLRKGSFCALDARNLSFRDQSFELVMAVGTLHCLGMDWQIGFSEMKRCAKKYILISRLPLTSGKSFLYDLEFKGKWNRVLAVQPMIVIGEKEFENFVSKLNLKIINKSVSSETISIDGHSTRVSPYDYLLSCA